MTKKKYKSNNQERFGFNLNGYDLWSNIMALFDPYNNPSNWKVLCCAYLLIIYPLHFTLFLDLESWHVCVGHLWSFPLSHIISWHVFKVLLSIPLRSVNYINHLISFFLTARFEGMDLLCSGRDSYFPLYTVTTI
jgi:hypothetical protein